MGRRACGRQAVPPRRAGEYQARYGTQVDLDRTRRLCAQHGLVLAIDL
jgi:hypothetical protein